MNREQKEKLVDEILEMNEIMNTVRDIDSMAKGFVMLAFVQEAFSEIKAEAITAKFSGVLVGPGSVTPPHCPYMKGLAYDKQTSLWSAKCSVTERYCNVQDYGLAAYRDCLHYRGYEVSTRLKVISEQIAELKKPNAELRKI